MTGSSFMFLQHMWRFFIVVAGVVLGFAFERNVSSSFALLLFHAVPTFYAWELVYLYTPIRLPDVYSESSAMLNLGVESAASQGASSAGGELHVVSASASMQGGDVDVVDVELHSAEV
jgi:hypothetical protein